MAIDIKPTRSELMKLKKRIKLAKSGYNLLKKKRDGLILDFFEILKKARTIRAELAAEFANAQQKMNKARVLESDFKIRSIALAISSQPQVHIESKNIMGVVIPKIESKERKSGFLERGYGVYNSAAIDETADAYERVIAKVIYAAEVETSVHKLLAEIEKTKRRVNALEFDVIPKMNKMKAFISLRLEEMERENVFRMKRKKK